MAFVRPLLPVLAERIAQDLISRLGLSTPLLRRSMVYVLARVIAGAAHMLHGHLEFLSRQIFPDLAEAEYLARWGALFGLSFNPAAYSDGTATATGSDGVVIPEGTVLVRADGTKYVTDAAVTVSSNLATLALTALLAGADGNCDAGTELSFESPISGVDATATSDELSGGTDQETADAFRVRVLDRMRQPPHGGAAADYIAWAKEVPGVTRVWVFPLEEGPGTVVIRFVRDDDGTGADIIPSAAEVLAVQQKLTGTNAVAPVTAEPLVYAPVAQALNFSLSITPDNPATRIAVQAALEDLLARIGAPGGTIPRSQVEIAVGTADGVTDFAVLAPAANVVHVVDNMPILGTITWL